MKNLRILQFRGKSTISRLIRFYTWGEYSHSAVWNITTGEVIESWQTKGVRIIDLVNHKHTPGTKVDVYEVLGIINEDKYWNSLKEEVGKKYDWWGIFGFLSKKETQKNKKWFCSELVFKKLAPQLLLLNCPASHVSPTVLTWSPLLQFEKQIVLE